MDPDKGYEFIKKQVVLNTLKNYLYKNKNKYVIDPTYQKV